MRCTAATILLSLLLPAAARAQQADRPEPEPRTVTVRATSVAEREPDRAVLDVAVETFAEDARMAAERNARTTAAVIDALREAGVPDDRIRTVDYGLRPEYEFERDPQARDRRLVGFRATNTVRVTIDELDRVGAVIDAAVAAGANRIAALRFELADPDALRREALRRAMAVASADAQAIARAAGLGLGPLLRVSTGAVPIVEPRPEVAQAMRRLDLPAPPTPIEPGRVRARATVTAVYVLEPR